MTALETALSLLSEGLWPVPVTAPDDRNSINPGKAPIGADWGKVRHTPGTLRRIFDANPGAGVGLRLGPAGGVIDLDVDDPEQARPVLARLFPAGEPATRGWSSARGHHLLFLWHDRLAALGKAIIKGHPKYPGIEIRLGWSAEDKQYQTVVPPSIGDDGRPREWNGIGQVLEMPESFFGDLLLNLAEAPRAASPTAVLRPRSVRAWDAEQRAAAYLKKCDPAIQGQDGSGRCFKAACKIGPGFDLPPETALRLLGDLYNPTCRPPWSEKELRHKVDDAYKVEARRGWLLDAGHTNGHAPGPAVAVLAAPAREGPGRGEAEAEAEAGPSESPDDPFRLARSFLLGTAADDGSPTLRYWLEEWHQWDGTRYQVVAGAEVRASMAQHVKREFDREAERSGKAPARVTTGIVANVMLAMTGLCLLSRRECPDQPAWLDYRHEDLPSPREVIAAPNGLIHLPALVDGRDGILPPTPRFFSPNCLSYEFDPEAPRPDHWLAFLDSIWGDDPESIACLQEWFGYLLTPDTAQQKILVLIGPTRSGKGTIAKALAALVGELNVSSPTLSGMANNFGIAPLIGKMVAIFPDARLSGRADSQVIVERLLSISGEDNQTIDRKHLSSWSGHLTSRFVLISNELPRLGDSSGAITARTIILRMTRSFLGREDTALYPRIAAELPSILLWSIAGWARLRRRGRFLQPESGGELMEEMRELASPIGSFIEERCERGPELSVPIKTLYEAWKTFCVDRGRDHPGDEQGFGRALRAAVPTLKVRRTGSDGHRVREYVGIGLKVAY